MIESQQQENIINQIDAPKGADDNVLIVNGRYPDGTFAPKNDIHLSSTRGRGWARPSDRLARFMNDKTVAEVKDIITEKDFENKTSLLDSAVLKRALAAAEGNYAAIDFVFDRLEGKATNKTEITGKDGQPLAVATADVTSLLLEVAEELEEK